MLFGARSALLFILQSIVVGLAVAFLVVIFRPDLLPTIAANGKLAPASYADAVEISAPSVASVYTKRLVEYGSEKRPSLKMMLISATASTT